VLWASRRWINDRSRTGRCRDGRRGEDNVIAVWKNEGDGGGGLRAKRRLLMYRLVSPMNRQLVSTESHHPECHPRTLEAA
jgi:hypothetical protein